ncbi:MAG: hypothetical protein G8345_14355 [Magnetococcales bacterium]|nr:hypothetical protein [Magnetococcales bacterium]
MRWKKLTTSLALVTVMVTLTACGATRSYHQELSSSLDAIQRGQVDAALAVLEKNNEGADKDLLYHFEKGAMVRLKNDLTGSTQAWQSADEMIAQWEESVKVDAAKVLGEVGGALVNDRVRKYDGYDYEKVMLSTELALNHFLAGNKEAARVEIKKTHEREAIIAEFRAKELAKAEEEAKEKSVKSTYKDLNGYPVEVLDDPEVVSLKNGYQSAFSHYLAGFIYEAMGEPSLAAPGYRQAVELRPNVPILDNTLSGLEKRLKKSGKKVEKEDPKGKKGATKKVKETDVLFVVEAGMAPARESFSVHLPIPVGGGLVASSFTVPLIKPTNTSAPLELTLTKGPKVPLTVITSIDAMSRRALKDEMPAIIVRNIIRAIAKGAIQKVAQDRHAVLGLLAAVASVATEGADERAWRTLPAVISIGRVPVPEGEYSLTLGTSQQTVKISGSHQVVLLRMIGSQLYLADALPTSSK